MTELFFVDTNVLVYARDAGQRIKQERAQRWMDFLWRSRRGRISTQVISELFVTVTKKLSHPIQESLAIEEVRALMSWEPASISTATINLGLNIIQRHKISWWDSLIIASTIETQCRYLLTEDLQENQTFEGCRVVNPFQVGPEML